MIYSKVEDISSKSGWTIALKNEHSQAINDDSYCSFRIRNQV